MPHRTPLMKNELLAEVLKDHLVNFENHEAILIVDSDEVQIMDWKINGSSNYAIRFVINGNHLYLSGDLGSGGFDLTWFPRFTDKWNESYHYLKEKIDSWSEGDCVWSQETLKNDIKEWVEDFENKDNYWEDIDNIEETLWDCYRGELPWC